jgi:hypothetical protein
MFAASKSAKAAAVVAATDPFFPYVPLLLNTTSTNGKNNQGTTTTNGFLDSGTANGGVGFTITRNGNPTQGSINAYWPSGYWSNYFSGSGNYASISSTPIAATTSTFTIEGWIFPTSAFVGTIPALIGDMSATGVTDYFSFGPTSANTLQILWFDGTVKTCTGNTTISLNVWTHVAISVNSNAISLYVNGVQQTLSGTTTLTNRAGTTNGFVIAQLNSGANYYTGYVSNLSVLNGTAKYNTGFTPSTNPLGTSTTNQTLLACYANRFIDSNTATTAKTITSTGSPAAQTFQPFSPIASYTTAAYGGSGYFNGSSDYLTGPNDAAFAFGTGDFTIEAWVYVPSFATRVLFSNSGGATSNNINFFITSDGKLNANNRNVAQISSSSSLTVNAWNHAAITKLSGTYYFWINGAASGNFASLGTSNNLTDNACWIGARPTPTEYWLGYISNLRVVKGTAVYTGAFTPPTLAPLTTAGSTSAASYSNTTNVNTSFASSSTSLLTNFTNAGIYDAAAKNNIFTVGDAQVSTTITAKWPPTSMKFDGTGDWLTAIDGAQLQLNTSDFTIDGWVYLSAINVAYGIVSKGTATTGWSANITSLNKFQFSHTTFNLTGTTSLAASTWYYFAVVKSGSASGNLKLYLNGSLEATAVGALTTNFNQTDILYVGADRIGTSPLNGYLQDVRITKYARTITTPTAAFPTR